MDIQTSNTNGAQDVSGKNLKRGMRQKRTARVRITRGHRKVHLGIKRREEDEKSEFIGVGALAKGVLVKKGVRTSTPRNPKWQQVKTRAQHALAQFGFSTTLTP